MKKKTGTFRIGNYFRYSWWKYAVLFVLVFVLWNLAFTVTEPRPPEEEKLDLVIASGYADQYRADLLKQELAEKFPEMKETSVLYIPLDTDDPNGYAYQIQFVVQLSAQEGDMFIISRERLLTGLGEGDPALNLDTLPQLQGLPMVEQDGKSIGVDISSLTGLREYISFDPEGCAVFLPYYCSNPQESAEVILWLFERFAG